MNEELRVAVPDGELHVSHTGSGPAVALLHSGILDSTMWDEQVVALVAAGFHVVRFDFRSHGRSSTATTAHRHDDDLEAVLDALAVGRAALVGSSLGGAVAMDFALTRPDRTTSVALLGGGIAPIRYSDHALACQAEMASAAAAMDAERWMAVFLRYGVDGPYRDAGQVDPAVRARCGAMAMGTALAHHTGTGEILYRDAGLHLEEIEAPTVLATGEFEGPDVVAASDEAARRMPRARRVVLPGVGHMANLEDPAAVAALLGGHLGATVAVG